MSDFLPISPTERIEVTVSYLYCDNGKLKTISFGIKLDSPKWVNQKFYGGKLLPYKIKQ